MPPYAPYNEEEELAKMTRSSMPWRPVALAVFLFVSGLLMILVGMFIIYDHITHHVNDGHGIGLTVLGFFVFLPGFYHTRIAYKAWKGERGYNFNQIPEI